MKGPLLPCALGGLIACVTAFASAVEAQDGGSAITLACRFETECVAPSGCKDADVAATLSIDPAVETGAPDARLTTGAEAIDLTLFADVFGDLSQSAATFSGRGATGFHTIAREPDGRAVYTVTTGDGPRSTTYLGRCEVTG